MPESDIKQNINPPHPPANPCLSCGYWSAGCNQSACSRFKEYKQEIKRLGLNMYGGHVLN
ncbi:MAG: hypothetical protein LBK26_02825 [Rickettsiales bacterium]|jgi:hypothetical protein|nr:hypothetical protein [Rickettsiales bacterium]